MLLSKKNSPVHTRTRLASRGRGAASISIKQKHSHGPVQASEAKGDPENDDDDWEDDVEDDIDVQSQDVPTPEAEQHYTPTSKAASHSDGAAAAAEEHPPPVGISDKTLLVTALTDMGALDEYAVHVPRLTAAIKSLAPDIGVQRCLDLIPRLKTCFDCTSVCAPVDSPALLPLIVRIKRARRRCFRTTPERRHLVPKVDKLATVFLIRITSGSVLFSLLALVQMSLFGDHFFIRSTRTTPSLVPISIW